MGASQRQGRKPLNMEEVKKNYFNCVKKAQKKIKVHNAKSMINFFFAFKKKHFKSTLTSTRMWGDRLKTKNTECSYSKYIIKRLSRISKPDWIKYLKKDISEEKLPFNEPHLSNCFYIEYYLSTAPEVVKNTDENGAEVPFSSELSKDSITDLPDNYLSNNRNYDSDSKVFKEETEKSKMIKSLFNKRILEDFGESLLNNSKSISRTTKKDYLDSRGSVKEHIKCFKYLLQQRDFDLPHPILFIIKKVAFRMNQHMERNNFTFSKEELDEFIQTVQRLILEIENALKIMYIKEIDYENFYGERDEITNLITYFLFHEPKISDNLRRIYGTYFEKKIEKYAEILNNLKNKPPSYFKLNEKFSLDKETINYKIKLIDQKIELKPSLEESLSPLKVKIKEQYSEENFAYDKALKVLLSIKGIISPVQKMKVIGMLSEAITNCVDEFYKDITDVIKNRRWTEIDSDTLSNIFLYLLSKANQPEMLVDFKIINDFVTDVSKGEMTGFHFCSLNLAFDNLQNFFEEESLV